MISETAVYGVSSILARGLYYLLTLVFGRIFLPEEFGIFSDLYAITGFLLVILTHGMETSFFRHYHVTGIGNRAYFTSMMSVTTVSLLFLFFSNIFLEPIASLLKYEDRPEYISWFSFIVAFDVIAAIPFAHLRARNKAVVFASIKILNIALLIGLNVLFLLLIPFWIKSGYLSETGLLGWYDPELRIGYVFLSNLVASGITLLFLLPELRFMRREWDWELFRRMFRYSLPIMLVGLAGAVNELFDRLMLRRLLPYDDLENLRQLGIYGYSYKLAMIMTLFLQAFKFAIEPFYFSKAESREAPAVYAGITRIFVVIGCLLFLLIGLNVDLIGLLFRAFNFAESYEEGLQVVPILLGANLFLGIYFNVSVWYKVSDNTIFGAGIAFAGAAVTIALNIYWIPRIGYMGSAWATLICYVFMVAAALYFGRTRYPVPYQWGKMLAYLVLTLVIYSGYTQIGPRLDDILSAVLLKLSALAIFVIAVLRIESIPFRSLKFWRST